MKRFSDVRKIKIFGDIINRNENFLLPNSLLEGTLIDDNIQYPTQFFISNSNLKENENANNKQLIKSNRTYSQLMEIPDLSLPLTDILNIYDIDTYDELIDLIPIEDSEDSLEIDERLKNEINKTLSVLETRERMIIEAYFGINTDCRPMTLEAIGERYNLTKERIRQIKEKAIRKLRHNAHDLYNLINE
jgi:RNA polymerase sigma factor (sigma-70 family)